MNPLFNEELDDLAEGVEIDFTIPVNWGDYRRIDALKGKFWCGQYLFLLSG